MLWKTLWEPAGTPLAKVIGKENCWLYCLTHEKVYLKICVGRVHNLTKCLLLDFFMFSLLRLLWLFVRDLGGGFLTLGLPEPKAKAPRIQNKHPKNQNADAWLFRKHKAWILEIVGSRASRGRLLHPYQWHHHSSSCSTHSLKSQKMEQKSTATKTNTFKKGLQSKPFTNRKHLAYHETENLAKETQDWWTARILCQTRMEQYSSSKNPANGLLTSQRFTNCW